MALIEPLLLSRFGTTPGKAILGLHISHSDGSYLSYVAALERTANVLIYGEGLRIPFLSLWRNWQSYKKCENGEELEWEEHSVLSLRDERGVRALWFILAEVLLFALNFCLVYTEFIPRNTGELTIAEFAENFNYVAERQDYAPDMRLDPDGSWIEYGGTIIHIFGGDYGRPDFEYETDGNGYITAIRMEKYYTDLGGYPPNIDSEMALAIQAFVRPRQGFINFGDETAEVLELLDRSTWKSWGAQCNGVNITHRTELEGYQYIVSLLKPIEGEEQSCTLFFEMKVIK